ncbi:Putative transposase [Methylobacterium oryzae CBMB20]|uniref:Transposase n=1 Tax=Methylobacterium oryzae CBMB20 TaxID=693986 RepID=A0A089P0M3_9HYPH|nr:Putative transposase [Methylobacterium oryzae CBMB20]
MIEPFMPKDHPEPERKDDRQIISGILHVLTSGSRWRDCPVAYGPRTTVYARFNRRSRRGFWKSTLAALAKAEWAGDAAALDSSLRPPQRLPPHCHPLRQTRPQLRLGPRSGRRHRLLVLIKSTP